MIRFVLLVSVVVGVAFGSADDNSISVPKDLMRFILNCQSDNSQDEVAVPVYHSTIKDSATSQHISLLNMEELNHALRKTVHSDVVLGHIMEQVEEAVQSSSNPKGRSGCSVENHIEIEIPPQEVEEFQDRLQILTQQNNVLLLQQINSLFTYKLRTQRQDMEKLVKRRTNQILTKLNRILFSLGIEDDDDDDDDSSDEDTTESFLQEEAAITPLSSDEKEQVEDAELDPVCKCKKKNNTESTPQPEPQPESEPEPQPESEPEPQPESEPEPQPESEPEPAPEPVPVTEAPAPVAITTFFPIIDISDEKDDDDNSSPESSREAILPLFERVAQKPAGFQQPNEPINFSSNLGLMQPMVRPIRRRVVQRVHEPRPVYPSQSYRLN